MLYSPPRKSRSKIGSTCVLAIGRMYSTCARKPNEVRLVWRKNADGLGARLDEVGVAAQAGEVARERQAAAVLGKIGLSTVLNTKLGTTLLIVRSPPCPMSSESCRNGLLSSTASTSGLSCDRSSRSISRHPPSRRKARRIEERLVEVADLGPS